MSDFVGRLADAIKTTPAPLEYRSFTSDLNNIVWSELGPADDGIREMFQEAARRVAQCVLRELMEPSDEMYEASMREESTTDRLQAMLRAFAAANGIEIEGEGDVAQK